MILPLLTFLIRPTIVLNNFEQPTYGAWKTTGTAFGKGPAQGGFANQRPVTGYQGHGIVDTYLPGDDAEGTLTSPSFVIRRKYINFLMGGGFQPGNAGMKLLIRNKSVRDATGKAITNSDPEDLTWQTWNVSHLQGKTARIEIYDHALGGWGHVNVDQIEESDTPKAKPILMPKLYQETYRPQFHFSAKRNWLNDPNGLVFYKGVWNLFFQYNSKGIQSAYKNWGHAVSPDLMHWKQLPVAIKPDSRGEVWSGSAAVDFHDTCGVSKEGTPVLVAMYTAAGNPFTQCLVTSLDDGKTWQKFKGNPVLHHIVGEDRDPRIFWYQPQHKWILVLYLDGNEFGIYSSPDLRHWKEESRFVIPGTAECPELFEMPVSNQKGVSKWVFYAGNYHYVVGNFDGAHFTPSQSSIQGDFGDTFYASQTYNNAPDGRRVQIGWMNGPGPMPGNPFNQQMSIPCDLTLTETANGYRVSRWPVKELDSLHRKSVAGTNLSVSGANERLKELKGDLYDISFQLHFSNNEPLDLNVRGTHIRFDPAVDEVKMMDTTAPMKNRDGTVDVRVLVDRSSLEVFLDHGLVTVTRYFQPPADNHELKFEGSPNTKIELKGYEVDSTWRKQR